ncbi:hypothetical protein [Luteolibacter marinus]|uniref:hypothetical protein n=1 Tax=Luteolibacter marinus TaxID=2776705 RepID=UPI0018692D98|nr:hypothetical protein [Luteolibacter marinus]
MNPFRHLFATYFRRFRVELVLWWGITFTCDLLTLRNSPIDLLAGAARIEVIAALWVVLRISLADEVFGTLGGKEVRPLARGEATKSRIALVALALVPPLLARGFVVSFWAPSNAAGIGHWLSHEALPVVQRLVFLAAFLQIAAMVSRRSGSRKVVRALVWGGSLLLLVKLAGAWVGAPGAALQYRVMNGEREVQLSATEITAPVFRALPGSPTVIAARSNSSYLEVEASPAVRLVRKVILEEGQTERSGDGLEWRIRGITWKLSDLELRFSVRGSPGQIRGIQEALRRSCLLVRYGGGPFASAVDGTLVLSSADLALAPLDEVVVTVRFLSPLILPANRRSRSEVMDGAELWVFGQLDVLEAPDIATPVRWNRTRIDRNDRQDRRPGSFEAFLSNQDGTFLITPDIPTEEEAGLEVQVDACMSLLRLSWQGEKQDAPFIRDLLTKGRRLVPQVLRWPAWSWGQWDAIVRPVLLKHAGDEDLPELEKRLAVEPRLTEVFIAKGWTKQALPALRGRLQRGQSLPPEAIELLAREQDPDLAGDLGRIATRLGGDVERIGPLLREYPGFDWEGFVAEMWKRRKYGSGSAGMVAAWAAELGDRSGLEILVRALASRDGRSPEPVVALIPEAAADPLGFLRANLENLEYDSSTRTWRTKP